MEIVSGMMRMCCAVMLATALWPEPARAGENIAAELLSMTGARTKVVFARRIWGPNETADSKFNADIGLGHSATAHYAIMVFDTSEGVERVVAPDALAKHPLITPSGRRVIYDTFLGPEQKIYIVDWDGRNGHFLCEGNKSAGVAEDPPGTEWVYIQDSGKCWRRQIDNPAVQEMVWDKTGADWFWAFTRDGKRAATGLPWPNACVLNLPNGSFQTFGGGCGLGLGADGEHCFHLTAAQNHKGIEMHAKPGAPGKYIDFSVAPGVNGHPIYFPAFARYDSRFVSCTGPQRGGNDPGPGACVLIGQFNESFTGVTKWVKVTTSPTFDIGAYVWIQQGQDTAAKITAGLNVKILTAFVTRLDQASKVKPVLEQLKKQIETSKNPDEIKEGEVIVKHIENWGKGQLAAAQEAEADAPREAETKYKNLAAKMEGLETGDTAQARLKDKDLQDGIRAWPYVERLLKAEKELVNVPGTERIATDEKFAAKNKFKLDDMKGIARLLQQQYPSACVIKTANEVLGRYKLDQITAGSAGVSPAPVAGGTPSLPGWPSERKGLIFLWENLKKPILAFDPAGVAMPAYRLLPRGLARLDRNNVMWLQDGAFTAPNLEKFLMVQKNSELSIEAYIIPENLKSSGLAEIASFSSTADTYNFFLGQLNGKLVVSLKTSENPAPQPVELCALTAGEPAHIVVSYAPGALACYKNGKLATVANNIKGSFGNWSEQHLLFGSNWDGQHAWSGSLEGIALYTRPIETKEAQQNFAAYASRIKDRKTPPRLEMQAKLLAKSKTTSYESVAPYTQVLVAYEYEVEKVTAGKYVGKTIRVSHYGMMDRKPLAISRAEIGKSYALTLELLADNPQLETDLTEDELPIDPHAVMYFDAGPLKR